MGGAGFGTRTSGSWTNVPSKGLGCMTESGMAEFLGLHLIGSFFISRWRCLPPQSCFHQALAAGQGHLQAFPASLYAADQVCLLTLGSLAPCFGRMLVERFSMSLQVIPPVHPGETVFLPRRHPLYCILDCSHLKPRSHLEGLFLR